MGGGRILGGGHVVRYRGLVAFVASTVVAHGAVAEPLIDTAQTRPRGEPTRHLLEESIDSRLQSDLETLVSQEVARRALPTTAPPLDAPRFTNDQIGALSWWAGDRAGTPLRLTELLDQTVASSYQIGVFSELPAIRQTSVDEAEGRYAPEIYAEGRYNARNEPTTSLAETRGDERLNEKETAVEFGVRDRLRTGAQVTLSQRFSNLDTNLIDYAPQQQARSRTVLGITQPLLREGGTAYNSAITRIARLETDVAASEFARQAESHLLDVVRSYWTLYLARAALAQQQRAADAVDAILGRIEKRAGFDGLALQANRARAVAAERRAGLVRSESAVRNAESRLRALTNAPGLGGTLTISETPATTFHPTGPRALAEAALTARPEIKQGLLAYRSALLREGMAANEKLPQLDLIGEVSVNGRRGNFDFGGGFSDATQAPVSYSGGLRLSIPLGNDERKARYARRRIETNQSALQLRATVETVLLEATVAENEYRVAYAEMMHRAQALQFAREDQRVLGDRYASGIGANGTTATGLTDGLVYLDRLLDSQTRVADIERELVEAQATFQVAGAAVARARGTLLADLGYAVTSSRGSDGLPRFTLSPRAGLR